MYIVFLTDINECENSRICDDRCINTIGSFFCECYPGYQLNNDDLMTCSGMKKYIIHSYVHTYKCTYIHAYMHTLQYVYTYMHTHTHTSSAFTQDKWYRPHRRETLFLYNI